LTNISWKIKVRVKAQLKGGICMIVQNFMCKNAISVTLQTPVPQIWQLILKKHIHVVPVVDKEKKVLGVIAEADLLSKLYPDYKDVIEEWATAEKLEDEELEEKLGLHKHQKAKDVMNKHLIFVRPDTHIMKALSKMMVKQVRSLPVLDDDNKLIGMISKGDIFDTLFKKFTK
jgi:CBS-domain-containing membrane protein